MRAPSLLVLIKEDVGVVKLYSVEESLPAGMAVLRVWTYFLLQDIGTSPVPS